VTDSKHVVDIFVIQSHLNEAPVVRTLTLYITGLQVLHITSLVTHYKQITNSLHERSTQKSLLAYCSIKLTALKCNKIISDK